MHQFDVALKRSLTRPGSALLAALLRAAGLESLVDVRWLNVELPKVSNLRVDQLGQLPDGHLIQIECQSENDKHIAMRMAEYFFAIWRAHKQIPIQIVLYVGRMPLRMRNTIAVPGLTYRFHIVDVRDLDGEPLLASANLSDNVFAVLTRLGSRPGTVRRILERIANGTGPLRGEALTELFILAGLRKLNPEIEREAKKMPIVTDKLLREVFGPQIRQGRAEGEMRILLRMIRSRFGPISPAVRRRLEELTPNQLRSVSLRLLDAKRVGDIFPKPK